MAPAPSDLVTCPACGSQVERCDAREYDPQGNRWERTGKTFEFFCKPCFREICQLPRKDLEETLCRIDGPHDSPAAFLAAYYDAVRSSQEPRR